MKLSFKIIVLVMLMMTGLNSGINAQPGPGNKQKRMERIESQRVAFITDRLQLTPSEAQVFWPVFNEYEARRKALSKNFQKTLPGEEKRFEDMSDKEAIEVADNQLVEAQKLLDLRKEYHAKFKSVLPPQKVLGLYETEKDFQRHLIDQLRGGKGAGMGPGKGPGKGQGKGPGTGQGKGAGPGNGKGLQLRDGSCVGTPNNE